MTDLRASGHQREGYLPCERRGLLGFNSDLPRFQVTRTQRIKIRFWHCALISVPTLPLFLVFLLPRPRKSVPEDKTWLRSSPMSHKAELALSCLVSLKLVTHSGVAVALPYLAYIMESPCSSRCPYRQFEPRAFEVSSSYESLLTTLH
jgi:hypothetical protein